MEKETLKNIFNLLEKNDNRNAPFIWKLNNNEPFTEDELVITSNLDLNFKQITSLPEGLIVERDLRLYLSDITSLPKGLKVYRNIYINSTKLTDFSNEELEEMIKPGFIKGRIYR